MQYIHLILQQIKIKALYYFMSPSHSASSSASSAQTALKTLLCVCNKMKDSVGLKPDTLEQIW